MASGAAASVLVVAAMVSVAHNSLDDKWPCEGEWLMARMGGIPDGKISPAWRSYLEWWDGIKDYRCLTPEELRDGEFVWESVLEADADSLSKRDMAARLRKVALGGVTNCLSHMSDTFDFVDNGHGDRLPSENTTQEMAIVLQSQEVILRALLCILKESG